jgi:hypothetical protein
VDYDEIHEEAQASGRRVEELLALTKVNDPFFAGMPSRAASGQWFAALWRTLGAPSSFHLRRMHYQLVSQEPPTRLPSGTPYENTESAWQALNTASRNARYLGLIDVRVIDDHRSPRPLLSATSRPTPTPSWYIDRLLGFEFETLNLGAAFDPPTLPSLDSDILALDVYLPVPSPSISGYSYDQADQPYYLSIWIEKSTMDDVLVPLCQRLGIDLVRGVGFLTISSIRDMLLRVARHGKPSRIFYISDFDPSGETMPVQVSRQSEFWLSQLAPGADLRITPLALTAEQARRYALPRTPIKEGHTARAGFEARHGAGATELDALEALQPGELARLVEDAVAPYIDQGLPRRLALAHHDASRLVTSAWEDATEEERDELEAIEGEAEAIVGPYREQLEAIARGLNDELAPLTERLDAVWQAMREKAGTLSVELPERPSADVDPPDEEDWLFDADRDYFDQLDYYKEQRPSLTRAAVKLRATCEICQRPFSTVRADARTCSADCRAELERRRSKAKHAVRLPPRACDVCEAMFAPTKRTSRFCQKTCKERARTQERTAQRRAAGGGAS